MHQLVTCSAPPELRRRSVLATSLALAVLPAAPVRANFYETWPYVVPADVLPFVRHSAPPGDVGAVLAALDEFTTHYPAYQLGAVKGRLLSQAVRDVKPQRALELGSFLGYSALCTARELPPGGRLLCIEASPAHADVARTLVEYAGLA
jgi:predicted O-methyltransferase YrrM